MGHDAEGHLRFERDGSPPALEDDELLRQAVRVAVLANETEEEPGEREEEESERPAGDPMEFALLRLGREAGMPRIELLERLPGAWLEPFERKTSKMASYHDGGTASLIAVKGAPEAVIESSSRLASPDEPEQLSDEDRREWLEQAENMAAEGLRVLALAYREADRDAEPYAELVLLGLIGLLDPPREGVAEAVGQCRDAGIRVRICTCEPCCSIGPLRAA